MLVTRRQIFVAASVNVRTGPSAFVLPQSEQRNELELEKSHPTILHSHLLQRSKSSTLDLVEQC